MDPLDKSKPSQKKAVAPKDKKVETKTVSPSTANTKATPFWSKLFGKPAPAVTAYDDGGLWTPGTESRTFQLVFVLVLGVLLLWPANDWRLPLVERFIYEVADGKLFFRIQN